MKKSDIAAHVAGNTSVSKTDAESAVSAVFGAITHALARGESVSIAGFRRTSGGQRPGAQPAFGVLRVDCAGL